MKVNQDLLGNYTAYGELKYRHEYIIKLLNVTSISGEIPLYVSHSWIVLLSGSHNLLSVVFVQTDKV